MSTTFKSISAKIEISDPKKRESNYKETEVNLTSFFGGVKRGHSLQIGFVNEQNQYSHIQLDNENIQKLKNLLNHEF